MSERDPNHFLLVAARVYTRNLLTDLRDGPVVKWSAPSKLQTGDLALLYEMGKKDAPGDVVGRKEIGWLMRACSDARPDQKWGYAADFEATPLRTALTLDDARKASKLFAEGPGAMLTGGKKELSPAMWRQLSAAMARMNPELEAALAYPAELDKLLAQGPDLSVVSDRLTDADFAENREWQGERLLQYSIADLLDQEGWGSSPDETTGFGVPGLSGYYVPGRGFVDDILQLGDRHLLVVEYELAAHGNPKHGARQADSYRRAVRRQLPGWQIDAAVIARSFNQREFDAATTLGVECLQTGTGRRHRPTLTQVGDVRGAVWRARAKNRARRRFRRPRRRR